MLGIQLKAQGWLDTQKHTHTNTHRPSIRGVILLEGLGFRVYLGMHLESTLRPGAGPDPQYVVFFVIEGLGFRV